MAVNLLNWQSVQIDKDAGAVSLVINGNIDTKVGMRAWWFRDDEKKADKTLQVAAGDAFVLTMADIEGGKCRRLQVHFVAAQANPPENHLFVRMVIRQAAKPQPILTNDYEVDLPIGHNEWSVSDGVTLAI